MEELAHKRAISLHLELYVCPGLDVVTASQDSEAGAKTDFMSAKKTSHLVGVTFLFLQYANTCHHHTSSSDSSVGSLSIQNTTHTHKTNTHTHTHSLTHSLTHSHTHTVKRIHIQLQVVDFSWYSIFCTKIRNTYEMFCICLQHILKLISEDLTRLP